MSSSSEPPATGEEFHSAWQKFARGFHHAEHLKSYILTFSGEPQGEGFVTFEHVHIPERGAIVIRVASLGELPPYWSTTLGDVLFNYRSALDHVAWAIVGRGSRVPEALDERAQRDVYFPIARSEEDFRKQARRKLPGARPADLEIVRSHQPYQGRKFNPGHWLVRLSQLNNLDKHRAIQPMFLYPTEGSVEVAEPFNCSVIGVSAKQEPVRIEVGAEIATVPIRVTGPNPRISLDPHFTLEVGLDSDTTLPNLFRVCAGQIKRLLEQFSTRPDLDGAFAPLRREALDEADEDLTT